MATALKILVVDDDVEICELLQNYLQQQGYHVLFKHSGDGILSYIELEQIDLIVLDVMLPGEDGLSLCKKIRDHSDVMIIMLSAMGEDSDRIVGLEMGADDYLPKPFNPRELLARIKSLVRRTEGELGESRQQKQLEKVPAIEFGDWVIDRQKQQLISKDNVAIPLTKAEYNLLLAFVENANRVLNRDQLLNITHNRDAAPFDRTIDVLVGRLRKKLQDDLAEAKYITTIRGGGYMFNGEIKYV